MITQTAAILQPVTQFIETDDNNLILLEENREAGRKEEILEFCGT